MSYDEAVRRIEQVQWGEQVELDLRDLELKMVPESLGRLKFLRELSISRNQLTSVPESLSQLTGLQALCLDYNQLTSVPESLGQLRWLQVLKLNNNQLTSLPESLGQLKGLQVLDLRGNEGLRIPFEILVKLHEPQAILEYYFRIREGSRPLNEAKLILVGRGRVGKTSLLKKLKTGGFNPNESETEGIEINNWVTPVCFDKTTYKTENVLLHIWDFGGQEFVHATHRFFLTGRSLYLLVLNGRAGGVEAEAEYWLELIQGAGENSRVLVVLNKNEEHPFDMNRGLLEEKFTNICGFIKTDCKTGLGIEDLKRAIEYETARLEGVHASFPGSWFRLKERVSGMKEAFLTFDGFQRLCTEYKIEDADQDFLADVLDALGIALNFRKDAFLRDTHILNPRWVTGGVYAILYSTLVRNANGVMKLSDLRTILDLKEYPPQMHGFLMRLMQRFELCFPYPNDPDSFLIPELLPENQSDEVQTFSPEDCLNFEYHYSVLPEGLVPRFIVRTHEMSEGEPRWRTGVILNIEGCRVLVRADVLGKKILVRISGDERARRRVLSIVRSHFNAIHQAVKLKAEEMVPIPGNPHVTFSYVELIDFEKAGITEFPKSIEGKVVKISVKELLDGLRPSESISRNRLFKTITRLSESEFKTLITMIGVPWEHFPGGVASVSVCTVTLFQWAEGSGNYSLEDIAKTLDEVIGKGWRK